MFTIDYRIFSQIISIQLKYIQAPHFLFYMANACKTTQPIGYISQ